MRTQREQNVKFGQSICVLGAVRIVRILRDSLADVGQSNSELSDALTIGIRGTQFTGAEHRGRVHHDAMQIFAEAADVLGRAVGVVLVGAADDGRLESKAGRNRGGIIA